MFAYLRIFAMVSFVVVILAALALGYYFRSAATDDLTDLVTRNNKVLVQGFVNNLWKDHRMVKMLALFKQNKIPAADWPRYRGYKENNLDFQQDVFRFFEGMPVVKVTLYSADGSKLLSLNQAQILDAEVDNTVMLEDNGVATDAVNMALVGNEQIQLLQDARFSLAGGQKSEGTLVHTVFPIMSDNYVPLVQGAGAHGKSGNVQGVVEIYYDIARQWDRLYLFQFMSSGSIIIIFLLLIATLLNVAGRAEAVISRQHEANLQLAAQAATAETENQNKTQFLANISHELRTPLNAIIGFSEMIKSETYGELPNQQYKDYIRDIHQSGVHLLSLINDILDYSKAEAGKLEIMVDELDATKLILTSMRLVSTRAEQAQVALIEEVPREHYIMHTDGKKFKQVMLNLLSNAVKFTPAGGTVTVRMWQSSIEDTVSVAVQDSGIGIAAKDIARALAPFGQVDSALSRKYEGTGLGLPLTKKFVELMGGKFEITSEEGVGTTVTFTLPRHFGKETASA
jgi:two-component system cell cycle sensor histidine kinase PleC